jgi:hypothetical protein
VNRCEINADTEGLAIRIDPERSLWNFIVLPLLLLLIFLGSRNMGWGGFFLWVLSAWVAWQFVWNALGFENIDAQLSGIRVTSRVLFFHRTRWFAKESVESIAYHPHAYRSPAGIGMMVKDRLLPFQFGRELDPTEANILLQALETNVGWIRDKLRTADS